MSNPPTRQPATIALQSVLQGGGIGAMIILLGQNVIKPEIYSGRYSVVHATAHCLELGRHTSNADRIRWPIEGRINKLHKP